MQDIPAIEQTDESLVKTVLADQLREGLNTDAAIKELISRGFVIRLLTTGLQITSPGGIKIIKIRPKEPLSTETSITRPAVPSVQLSNGGLNLQFSQTTGWLGGLKSSVGLKAVLCISIVLPLIAGLVIYHSISSHRRQLQLESLVEQAKNLSSKVGKSANEGVGALQRVNQINARSTKNDIEKALSAVESAQEIESRSFKENQELVDFVRQNEADLRETELSDLVDMAAIYGDSYETYRKTLKEFLTSFKLMLEFERDNFSAVSLRKQPEESKYQTLYSDYMSAVEKQNDAYRAHMAFVDNVGKQNPKLGKALSDILSSYQNESDSQH